MARWSSEQKTKVTEFYLKSGSPILAQRQFRAFFKTREAPDRRTILRIAETFKAQGSVAEKRRTGRGCTALTPQKIREVANKVAKSPNVSVRRLAHEVGISFSSTRRVLKKRLKLHPYKMPVVQMISPDARMKRIEFSRWFSDKCARCPNFLRNLWWSDEAHFFLHGSGNRQNRRIWSNKPPKEALEAPLHSPKVTVWCAMGAQGIVGPVFVEDATGKTVTVTQESYRRVLVRFKRNLSKRCGDQLHQQWIQQDGAPAHTARTTMGWLAEHFPGRVVGKGAAIEWPPQSPDLTPLDFYLWGYVKEVVARQAPKSTEELKRVIQNVISRIPEETCARVAEEARRRAECCVARNGRHVEIA